MAKRKGLVPVRFSGQIDLGTLANETVIRGVTSAALEQDFHTISTDLTLAIRDMVADEGPLDAGLAAEDYTVAEIGECLNAQPLRSSGIAWEKSRRKVRTYAVFPGHDIDEVPEDPQPIRKKMFLHCPAGQSPAAVWLRNRSGAALSDTNGGFLEFEGIHWGRWQ